MAAQRPENINEIILDTAEELLKVNSFSEVTLAKIAEKANISKGTLYYYYKSKNEILFAVTDRYLSRQWDELIQWTENKEKDTSPHRLVNYVIERNIAYAGLRLHLFDAALLGDEEIRAKLIHRYDEFQNSFRQNRRENRRCFGRLFHLAYFDGFRWYYYSKQP